MLGFFWMIIKSTLTKELFNLDIISFIVITFNINNLLIR